MGSTLRRRLIGAGPAAATSSAPVVTTDVVQQPSEFLETYKRLMSKEQPLGANCGPGPGGVEGANGGEDEGVLVLIMEPGGSRPGARAPLLTALWVTSFTSGSERSRPDCGFALSTFDGFIASRTTPGSTRGPVGSAAVPMAPQVGRRSEDERGRRGGCTGGRHVHGEASRQVIGKSPRQERDGRPADTMSAPSEAERVAATCVRRCSKSRRERTTAGRPGTAAA